MYSSKKKNITTLVVSAALAAWFAVAPATAAPIEFDVAGSPASAVTATLGSSFCLGCFVTTTLSTDLDGLTFSLNQAESRTFDFFRIRVGGLGGALVDVSATLGFDLPTGASVSGAGEGGYATIFGKVSGGFLHWHADPYVVTLLDGSQFSVDFSDVSGFTIGNSAQVTATVTALKEAEVVDKAPLPESAAAAVPEPGTLSLILLSALGLLSALAASARTGARPAARVNPRVARMSAPVGALYK